MQVEVFREKLQRLRAPPVVTQQDATSTRSQLLARNLLQAGHVWPSRGTHVALGSVLLQLLLMQLSSFGRKPMFRQPVPWRFLNVTPPGDAAAHGGGAGGGSGDYGIELSGGSMQQLAAYSAVLQAAVPLYGPCVAPPLPWVSPQRGCYALSHSHQQRFRVDLMRTKTPAQGRALQQAHRAGAPDAAHGDAADMIRGWVDAGDSRAPQPGLSHLYHSLNVLSSQAWSINSRVLEVRGPPPRRRSLTCCAGATLPPVARHHVAGCTSAPFRRACTRSIGPLQNQASPTTRWRAGVHRHATCAATTACECAAYGCRWCEQWMSGRRASGMCRCAPCRRRRSARRRTFTPARTLSRAPRATAAA